MLGKNFGDQGVVIIQADPASWSLGYKFVSSYKTFPVRFISFLCNSLLKGFTVLSWILSFLVGDRIVQVIFPALIVHRILIVVSQIVDVDFGDVVGCILRC